MSVLIGTGLSTCGHVIDTARNARRVLRASLCRVPGACGRLLENTAKTRPFRAQADFFLTLSVHACTLTAMLTTTTATAPTTGEHRCMRGAAATGTAPQRSQSGDSGRVDSADAGEVEGARTQRPTGPRHGPLSTPMRSHLRALALYRGMHRDHGWAVIGLEALLRTALTPVRSARVCRACRGTGLGCSWPPAMCGVCSGLGFEIRS